ncbi:MAG: sterol desaturase family protein [Bryobacteraceae bacterium]
MTPLLQDVLRLGVWLLLLLVIFVPLERLWALRPQPVLRLGFGTDLAYYFLSGLLPKLLLLLPISLLAGLAHSNTQIGFYAWVGGIPSVLRLPLAMVVSDIGSYWGHRWSHQIPFLWRFHSIHHGAEEIDWLVNSRVHPVDMVFVRLCGLVPMYLLGLAQPTGDGADLVPILVIVIGTVWGFFLHANVRWRFGWLEYLVSSPAFHHWHHTNDRPENTNKNYAALLPGVDRLFGTLYLPKAWPSQYGVNEPLPSDLAGQLLHPLTARTLPSSPNQPSRR